jgi:uncharacterized protein YggT (Ycf19 family)
MYMLSRIVNIIGGIIITLLGLRMIFMLFGASPNNQLVSFIYNASQPFVAPFFGLFNYTPDFGVVRFEFATLVALIVYAVATALISGLLGNGRRVTYY